MEDHRSSVQEEEENLWRRQRLPDEEENERDNDDDVDILRLLDSMDAYLTLSDSLSTILRQAWFELASARHSMGASRVNISLLDLKVHSATTYLQVTEHDVDSRVKQPCFTLCKWVSPENESSYSVEEKAGEDKAQAQSKNQLLRNRVASKSSETSTMTMSNTVPGLIVNDQIQKERFKSLSVFGTLVSPKLRDAQVSFEKALEILVDHANTRSSILSSLNQLSQNRGNAKK